MKFALEFTDIEIVVPLAQHLTLSHSKRCGFKNV